MELTLHTFLIICPLVFLAGLVDAIGGGGGLISLPAYLIAGVPTHAAIATNKLSSCCGTALATVRFVRNKMVNIKLAIPSIFAAIVGSAMGANLSLMVNERIMQYILIVILPIAAFLVLNKNLFCDNNDAELLITGRVYWTVIIAALIIGCYDGFYGPGTGTFLIIAFTVFGKIGMRKANGQAKIINLTTNITSLAVFMLNGQVMIILGVVAALCNMLGGYIGAGLVMTKGTKIVRPSIILVLFVLIIKMIFA